MKNLNLRKNCRGDVPVTILVIGVIAICGLALFSFFHSIGQTKDSFKGVERISEARINIEKNSLDTYYDEIKETKFKFSLSEKWLKEEVVFSVEYFEN